MGIASSSSMRPFIIILMTCILNECLNSHSMLYIFLKFTFLKLFTLIFQRWLFYDQCKQNVLAMDCTLERRQLKTLLTIDECGSKFARNSVFDRHLSPVWQKIAIKNYVSNYFWSTFIDSMNVLDCRLPVVDKVPFLQIVPTSNMLLCIGALLWWCIFKITMTSIDNNVHDFHCNNWTDNEWRPGRWDKSFRYH